MNHDHSENADEDPKGGLEPNLWVHQILASAFLFAVSFAGGVLGLILVRWRRQKHRDDPSNSNPSSSSGMMRRPPSWPMIQLQSFSGGCLLSLIVVQLFPEALSSGAGHADAEVPLSGILVLSGLLGLLWIEKAVHKCYREDEGGDKFLSESGGANKGCHHGEEDYERLLTAREDASSSQNSDDGRTAARCCVDNPAFVSVLAFMLAVGTHTFLEGFTVGAQRTSAAVWALATMLSAHKWILSLSLVSTMVQKEMKMCPIICLTLIFSLATPLGCLLGSSAASLSSESASGNVVTPIAVGTLLYVAVFDLLYKAFRDSPKNSLWPVFSLTLGAALVVLVQKLAM